MGVTRGDIGAVWRMFEDFPSKCFQNWITALCANLGKSIMHPTEQNNFPQLRKQKAKPFATIANWEKHQAIY